MTKSQPTDEEMAAIVAAYEALHPPIVVAPLALEAPKPPAWRFSGRWWSRPVASRRIRPG